MGQTIGAVCCTRNCSWAKNSFSCYTTRLFQSCCGVTPLAEELVVSAAATVIPGPAFAGMCHSLWPAGTWRLGDSRRVSDTAIMMVLCLLIWAMTLYQWYTVLLLQDQEIYDAVPQPRPQPSCVSYLSLCHFMRSLVVQAWGDQLGCWTELGCWRASKFLWHTPIHVLDTLQIASALLGRIL